MMYGPRHGLTCIHLYTINDAWTTTQSTPCPPTCHHQTSNDTFKHIASSNHKTSHTTNILSLIHIRHIYGKVILPASASKSGPKCHTEPSSTQHPTLPAFASKSGPKCHTKPNSTQRPSIGPTLMGPSLDWAK